jgi:cellulose synthase/poly-beta-1,6-N-acetylglucosamine synthase-like glycosyltransferase
METFFCALAFILMLQSLVALLAALRLAHYSLGTRSSRFDRYHPKAAIIVPCKGLDEGFEENIRALFAQDYRGYELIFVTESEADPAHAVLTRLIRESNHSAWLVVAGESQGCGQKVHNLRAALDTLDAVDRRAEVIVFADSDARPTINWLAELIAPLGDNRVGAATGFRWYLPVRGGFSSLLLSVWNASTLSVLGERSSLAWGGATAIRRENFERLGIKQHWDGAVSDDYVLAKTVHAAGQRIKFVPPCLVASHADASLRELLEFSTRQMTITRVYAPRLWWLALVTHLLYSLTFWGGLVWLSINGLGGGLGATLAWLLISIFVLGAMTGWLRAAVASRLLAAHQRQLRKHQWAYLLFGPLVSLLYLYNALASAFTRRIVWRGIGYEMISPSKTLIWHRPSPPAAADALAGLARPRRASARSSSP